MALNFPLYYILFDVYTPHSKISLILRSIASALCIILATHKILEDKYPTLLKVYWYFVITFCLPFFFTFMTLINELSWYWLLNLSTSIFLLLLITSTKIFIISMFVGSMFGYGLFYFLGYELVLGLHELNIETAIASFAAIFVIGIIFSYLRDQIENNLKISNKKFSSCNAALEKELTAKVAELQEALEVKKRFLNNINHEMRIPLSGVLNASKELYERAEFYSPDEQKQWTRIGFESSVRLVKLVEDVLDLAKFSSNQIYLNMQLMDMQVIIESCLQEARHITHALKKSDVKINAKVNAPVTKLVCDGARIAQVIQNLIANATQYGNNNNVITIALLESTFENKSAFLLEVSDTGPGIPEGEETKIFESFVESTRTRTPAGGKGLGLSICKEIIKKHNGRIWAENNPEGGAKFSFIIPTCVENPNTFIR